MRIPEGRVEGLVSTEVTRYILTHVMYEVEKARVIASNGKAAVILPVETEEGDTSGPILPIHFKEGRKRAKKAKKDPTFKANGGITYADGTGDPARMEGTDWAGGQIGNFPNIDTVIPERKGRVVSLNADLLKAVADALQDPKGKNPGFIRLFIPEKKDQAIRVEAWTKDDVVDGKVGVIMPLV